MVVVQYIKKEAILPIHLQCMDTVQKAAKDAGHLYKLYTEPPHHVHETSDYRFASDLMRLHLATEIPNMLWIDADTICYSLPNDGLLETGYPYFQDNDPMFDIGYFYVNGCKYYFEHLLALYDYHRYEDCGWIQKIINSAHEPVRALPRGHFQHLSLSRMLLDDNLSEYGVKGKFTVKRNNNNALELIIF